MAYIDHPFIKKNTVEERVYQQIIVARALERGNTLVVAPTALGKTIMAALLSAEVLRRKGGKILFLAPTKPLVEQHARTLRAVLNIDENKIVAATGTVPPEKRKKMFEESTVICATPHVVENDIVSGRVSLDHVSLLIFDEAHRAVGDYPYVFIANEYKNGLIFAITASPGSTEEKIGEICSNLRIKNIEVRTPKDPDVREYIKGFEVKWIKVELPNEFREAKKLIKEYMRERLRILKEKGIVHSTDVMSYSKKDLLAVQQRVSEEFFTAGNKELGGALVSIAALLKAYHALEVLETQGFIALNNYIERMTLRSLQPRAPKSLVDFTSDEKIRRLRTLLHETTKRGEIHPKVRKLKEILADFFKENPEKKAIVFVQYRDTASLLVKELKGICKSVRFVGQARRGEKGMSQKEQKEVIEKFKSGEYNVLIATSVAEEGLDIPSVDLVIFYEAVPSEIRFIQRRGRTGRFEKGKVIVLLAKGTRDETYYWIARAKERKMLEILEKIRKYMSTKQGQKTITEYAERNDKITIFADYREVTSGITKELHSSPEVSLVVKHLHVGDFIVSDRVCIERKTYSDFVNSIIDGRLFEQAKKVSEFYAKPVFIIEIDNKSTRNVHPNSIAGAISSLILDYGASIVFSRNPQETASIIKMLAKREQIDEKHIPRVRGGKKILSISEMQRYIVESLPNIGPKTAIELLKTFGTVENVFTASERDLSLVDGVGPKKAKEIRKILTEEYRDGTQ